MSINNGVINFKIPANHAFKIHSDIIELNQSKPVALRYGVNFRGACYPIRYFHGMLLDKVVYTDGTTEGWSATHFIFRAKSSNWSQERTAWLPPKPIKSLRVLLLFTGSANADFQLKDMYLKEDPSAFNTSNVKNNYHGAPSNLVSNNGFEIVKAGEAKNWTAFFKDHPCNASLTKNINYNIDNKIKRSGKYSLKLTNSTNSIAGVENFMYSIIDSTRTFTFSGWVKAEKATGLSFLEAVFFRAWAPIGVGSRAGLELNRVNNIAEQIGFLRTPITGGTHNWKKLSISGKAPVGANLVRFRIWSINNSGKIWVDDLEFDGFGNAPLELIISQLGYPAIGAKKVFVRSKLNQKQGSFVVRRNGKAIKSGKLLYKGINEWNYRDFECDFTEISQPGSYSIDVTVGKHKLSSKLFSITNKFYATLIEASRNFMYHMRCGCDIPGFHSACHLDDGQIRSKCNLQAGGKIIGHHPTWGGWHDAGDYDKYSGPAILPIVGLARLGKKNKSTKLHEEACWGADWLCRIATPTGIYYQVIRSLANGKIMIDLCPPESETDNIPGNVDDRVIIGIGHDSMCPWALVECALAEENPVKSKKYLDTALMIYHDFMSHSNPDSKVYKELYSTFLIRAELGLFKLTGDNKFFNLAQKHLAALLDDVEKINREKKWKTIKMQHYYPFGMLISPAYFALRYPNNKLAERCRKELKYFLESFVMPNLKSSPYRIIDPGKWAIAKDGQHHTLNNIGISALLALSSIIFNNPNYLTQAELNFYYITGHNPAGVSLISGYGDRVATTWAACNTIPGHANGTVLRGGVLKGVFRGSGKARGLASYMHNGTYDYNVDHPTNYPYVMIAGDYPMAGAKGCQEIWEALNGITMMAIDYILLAKEHFQGKTSN